MSGCGADVFTPSRLTMYLSLITAPRPGLDRREHLNSFTPERNLPSFEVDKSLDITRPQFRVWHAMPEKWRNMTLEVDESFDVKDFSKLRP